MNRFYLDLALSASAPQLEALIAFGATDQLVFGTDFPYASETGTMLNTQFLRTYMEINTNGNLLGGAKLTKNTVDLLKKHGIDINPKTISSNSSKM